MMFSWCWVGVGEEDALEVSEALMTAGWISLLPPSLPLLNASTSASERLLGEVWISPSFLLIASSSVRTASSAPGFSPSPSDKRIHDSDLFFHVRVTVAQPLSSSGGISS